MRRLHETAPFRGRAFKVIRHDGDDAKRRNPLAELAGHASNRPPNLLEPSGRRSVPAFPLSAAHWFTTNMQIKWPVARGTAGGTVNRNSDPRTRPKRRKPSKTRYNRRPRSQEQPDAHSDVNEPKNEHQTPRKTENKQLHAHVACISLQTRQQFG